ncbi:MAG TPA: SDR family oxidoreductase [Gaiellaceae bacterium]|nr:SDR family oxidoreductase [Gaiellaceae bacterium]
MQLENKKALVTGAGAIGGIGFEIAKLFAGEGAEVVITGRDAERGAEAAAALGGKARFVLADLTDLDSVRALADAAGEVDILVNNAAAVTFGPTPDQDVPSFDESFSANVRGPYFLVAALAPRMVANGGGSIINISTMVASFGMPGMSVYSATKAALESLTRTWAAEFAEGGVRVNTISPGPTRSAKVVGRMGDAAEQLGQTTPLKRMAETSEVAEAVLFLATDRASYVTGANLPVDGGRTAI